MCVPSLTNHDRVFVYRGRSFQRFVHGQMQGQFIVSQKIAPAFDRAFFHVQNVHPQLAQRHNVFLQDVLFTGCVAALRRVEQDFRGRSKQTARGLLAASNGRDGRLVPWQQ